MTHYLVGVDVNTGIFEADVVRNILDLYVKFVWCYFWIIYPTPNANSRNGDKAPIRWHHEYCVKSGLRVIVTTWIKHARLVALTYRLAALMAPPLRPPDGLGETPDALDPLGLRARIPPEESEDGIVELLRGNVLDEPGRLRDAESGLWKLGVRRTPVVVGVFCA